jgi:hypothetical protein
MARYVRDVLCTAILAALTAGCVESAEGPIGAESSSEDEQATADDDVQPPSESEPASQASAGLCTSKTITVYPGITTTGHLRYGQANVRFYVCSGEAAADWDRSIQVWHNTTGSAQGYDFINEEIHPVGDGDDREGRWRDYKATFKWNDCAPFWGWPCTARGTFTMNIHAEVPTSGRPFIVLSSFTAPRYWTLYNTP